MTPALARTRGPLGWSLGLSLALHAYALFALKVELGTAARAADAPDVVLQARLVPPPARPGAPPEVLKNTLDPPHAKPLADPIEPKRRARPPTKPKPPPAEAPPAAPSPGEIASARPEPRGLDLRLPPPERSGTGLRARAPERAEHLPPEVLRDTMGRLSEEMLYPPEALRRGLEGEVVVLVELGESGRILDASIASGSGHPELDAAAVRAVRKIGTLGPSAANKTILLPVRFKIM
ncbi:MAG: energy transducer TonB [Burkholderiales bacterium]|nr:energy transducer TonB [Burkholderiales bacterium]